MIEAINFEAEAMVRRAELAAQDRDDATAEDQAKRNEGFVQVYEKGWHRLQVLIQANPTAARIYAFFAQHIDSSAGAVVVAQTVLAEQLGISEITVRRQTKWLEDNNAIVRIRVGAGVYAYALDPEEIWRSWDSKKEYAAFNTKTLVSKRDRENGTIKRKLSVMISEKKGVAND